MNNKKSDMPKKLKIEFWVNEDMSLAIKQSPLELTTKEIKLFYFADNLVELRGELYEKKHNTLSQVDKETGRLYRILTYGLD
ncbi:MAG: hypothetical protein KJ646_01550 [Nanoarchaeota archaeon]|nr:hypothetical protein [Nanoarchaeota archaeon]MBU4116928.1 hypothetical protein [Nanoarchaeota archaeon]